MLPNSRKRQLEEPQVPPQAFIKRNREESIRSGAPEETLFCGFVPCKFPDCVRIHVDWKKYRICRFFNLHFGCDRPDCRYKHKRPTLEQQLESRVVRIPPPVLRPPLPSPPLPPLPSPPPPPHPSVQLLTEQQVDDVDTELEEDDDDTSTVPDEDTIKKIEAAEAAAEAAEAAAEAAEAARVAAILLARETQIKEEAIIAEREAKEAAEKEEEKRRNKERDNARGIFSYSDLFGPDVKFERN